MARQSKLNSSKPVRRIILAGGGTGGHLMPGIALAEEILARDPRNKVMFIGTQAGLETKVIPELGYELHVLPDIRSHGRMGIVLTAAKLPIILARARGAVKAFQPDAVVGLGGYASFAPVLAASIMKINTYLLEQNAIPGRTNLYLSRFVKAIFSQYREAIAAFPTPGKCIHAGNPLRRSILDACTNNPHRLAFGGIPNILVMGGSQGARPINELMISSMKLLKSVLGEFRLMHICGKDDVTEVKESAKNAGIEAEVYDFVNDMAGLFRRTDLVICRSGATTIAEITAFGIPSILIPYPHAKDDHQTANARALLRMGAAELIPQKSATPDQLATMAKWVLGSSSRHRIMSNASLKMALPNATQTCVNYMLGNRIESMAA